ncbi:MAG: DNA methyltransferase, partial [Comamonadaceae bacterium]
MSNAQFFVGDLCTLLGVARPHATLDQGYMFERPVKFKHGDGSTSTGRVDCYKRGSFCLESKKQRKRVDTKGFDDGLLLARSQAENYARALPGEEGRPPFLLILDIGTVIEVYAEFSRTGGTYTPFPDPRSHRIKLADLVLPEVRQRLRQIWLDPDSLNPARISAKVTREVAALLAQLAKSLDADSAHERATPEVIAAYLTRCLFSMFAEDVELLPKGSFLGLLKAHRDEPGALKIMLRSLWTDMDTGAFSIALKKEVLRFNGKLFKNSATDGYSLLLTPAQIDLLIAAAKTNWREVEPAIFGTLLERALNTKDRHMLGAHFTPRAYVERLVLPTIIEPLRAEWANAQAAALVLAHEATELEANPPIAKGGTDAASFNRKQLKEDQDASKRHETAVRAKWKEAHQQVKNFHHRLCTLRVLDPACGSGNFLYVTLEHLKRLEGEVVNQMADLGDAQESLTEGGKAVTLQQLCGIELNERAAAVAELVLWIGYLQWHIRTHGNKGVAEPVVHDYGNIECRDAVLDWDSLEPAYGSDGQLLTRWDGDTKRSHPVTGAMVPDESAQVPQWRYLNPRQALWPQADYIVGNPPFIGASSMRAALGDGYVEALRKVWKDVPESADFVMFWWARAAALVAHRQAGRFGFITTNSLRQTFNRRVVQSALNEESLALVFAIADHPWVDSANGAAVRIAMTVVAAAEPGRLLCVTSEQTGEHGEVAVTLTEKTGLIHADLTIGANVTSAVALKANSGVSSPGVKLHGA